MGTSPFYRKLYRRSDRKGATELYMSGNQSSGGRKKTASAGKNTKRKTDTQSRKATERENRLWDEVLLVVLLVVTVFLFVSNLGAGGGCGQCGKRFDVWLFRIVRLSVPDCSDAFNPVFSGQSGKLDSFCKDRRHPGGGAWISAPCCICFLPGTGRSKAWDRYSSIAKNTEPAEV